MWKLGRIAGIDVSIHWTLLALIAFTGFSNPGGFWTTVTLSSAIFGCVLLHELGHSLAARQFGIHTSSIVLLPIGGIASLERMPQNPLHELWVAIAGPLVNVAIAAVLFVGSTVLPLSIGEMAWLRTLLYANLVLVIFNMLPAFPMDGGRVLRALLAVRQPYLVATLRAARIGRYVALGLGLLGLVYGHLMLVLVAAFVFFAGAAEARMVAEEQQWRPLQSWTSSPMRPGRDNAAHVFTAVRPRETVQVVWDEKQRRYRHVSCV